MSKDLETHGTNTYRVGLLGAGGIAPEHIDALRLVRGVEIVSACDLREQRVRRLAQQYSIPRTYRSLAEMLAQEKLDVVHVLTQPEQHIERTMDCLQAGANVYVEKPMGLSIGECHQVAVEAAFRRLSVGVNHQMAHHPIVEEVVRAAQCGRFGRILHVACYFAIGAGDLPTQNPNHFMFSAPGSIVFEFCPHPFSVIRRLLGKAIDVTAVASQSTMLTNGKTYCQSWQIAVVADRGTADLYFSAGQGNSEAGFSVYGQDACAVADFRRGTLLFHENCHFPITANLRDGILNSGRAIGQSVRVLWDDYAVKLKMKPASCTNSFYRVMAPFYGALKHGNSVAEDANAGEDVIAYCEKAVANVKTVF